MPVTRQVISTMDEHGNDVMGPKILGYRYHDPSIVSGSLLTVESNHFAVVKAPRLP